MADKNKRTGLAPHVTDTAGDDFERVVIKFFNPAKGIGFLSQDSGPDVAFAVQKVSLPKLGPLIGDLAGTAETLFVRFSPDRKYLTEVRITTDDTATDKNLSPNMQRAIDLMLGKAPYAVLDESSKQLALEALKKAAGNPSVAKSPQPDTDKIVALPVTPEQKDEGRSNEPLLRYLNAKNIPHAMLSETAAEIERLVGKKLAAAVKRPRWDDRAKYPELQFLPAPEFLKRVWADQIGPTGEIEKELVRRQDRALMIAVEGYIKNRQRREIDAGAAHGLKLIARGYGGRKPGKKAKVTQK